MEFPIVYLIATDWSFYENQESIDNDFGLIDCEVVGFLIKETDDFMVISQEVFEGEVRRTTCIPKVNIKEIKKIGE